MTSKVLVMGDYQPKTPGERLAYEQGHKDARTAASSDGTNPRQLAIDVLVAHQRKNSQYCLCGWGELGMSHPAHVAAILDVAGCLRTRPPQRETGPDRIRRAITTDRGGDKAPPQPMHFSHGDAGCVPPPVDTDE
jgi:hypothetical protein